MTLICDDTTTGQTDGISYHKSQRDSMAQINRHLAQIERLLQRRERRISDPFDAKYAGE